MEAAAVHNVGNDEDEGDRHGGQREYLMEAISNAKAVGRHGGCTYLEKQLKELKMPAPIQPLQDANLMGQQLVKANIKHDKLKETLRKRIKENAER